MDSIRAASRDDIGTARPGAESGHPLAEGGEELAALAHALHRRAGVDLSDRELLRVASLVLDDIQDEGYDVVYQYPTEGMWSTETADDE
jgi:hypothetical protein